MRRTIENIVIGILIVSLLLAVLGVILTNEALTKAAFVVLMIVALAYTVLQVLDYFDALKTKDEKLQKQTFWFMVVSAVVAIAIVCISIFALAGKLF